MFFKKSPIALLIASALLMTACDQFLKGRSKEEEQKANVVEIKTDEINCLKEAPKNLQKFLDDEGDDQTIKNSIECVQNSLKTFMRLTRGSQPDAYLAKEVQYFFNTFLLKENKISDQFQSEIMKIKVLVVGGSPDIVTKLELEQFIQFLSQMREKLEPLRGQMRLAFFRQDRGQVQLESLVLFKSHLQSMSELILKKTKLTASRYQWVDFISFITELNKFTGDSKGLNQLLQWFPLLNSVKLLFLGENAKLVSETDWSASEKWVVDTYVGVLKFYYLIKDNELKAPKEWTMLLSWLQDLVHVIDSAPAMKDKKVLEASSIDGLIEEVFKLKLFKTVLTPNLVKSTYRKALVHIIEAHPGRGDAVAVSGLTDNHLRILKQEYATWKLAQTFINESYSQNPQTSLTQLSQLAKNYPIENKMQVSPLEQEEFNRSWLDFIQILSVQPGVSYTNDLKMHITYSAESKSLPFSGANMINAIRSFTRLVLRGYGDKNAKAHFDKKITRENLIYLEEDFRAFGRALSFLDPREKNAASRTFDQGNLFSYHGNGDDYLNALETYEILSVLISGGRTQVNKIYEDLENRRCLLSEKDIFNRYYVQEECFYQAFKANYKTYLDHVPGMVQFLSSLNDQQFAQTYQALLSIAYLKSKDQQGRVEFSELRTLQCVFNFIESLMAVYDLDKNGVLNEAEVVAAAPRFKAFIAKASPLGNFLTEDIFLYLVFTGKKPKTMKDGIEVTAFLAQRYLNPGGLGVTGKFNLIQLLSVLNNESK